MFIIVFFFWICRACILLRKSLKFEVKIGEISEKLATEIP